MCLFSDHENPVESKMENTNTMFALRNQNKRLLQFYISWFNLQTAKEAFAKSKPIKMCFLTSLSESP